MPDITTTYCCYLLNRTIVPGNKRSIDTAPDCGRNGSNRAVFATITRQKAPQLCVLSMCSDAKRRNYVFSACASDANFHSRFTASETESVKQSAHFSDWNGAVHQPACKVSCGRIRIAGRFPVGRCFLCFSTVFYTIFRTSCVLRIIIYLPLRQFIHRNFLLS